MSSHQMELQLLAMAVGLSTHLQALIAIDAQDYIAIGENGGMNRLWIYNLDDTLAHTLSDQFRSGGNGIACDKNHFFWVADYGYNRLVKY